MVATKAFEVSNSQKLRAFARKFDRPAPPDVNQAPQPKPRNDIFERMDLPRNIRQTSSLAQHIDVTPDTRYIFLFIVFNVCKLYPSLEQNGRPLLTPSSLVAYCLFLTYGFMLINDYQGRPHPSFWAHNFMDSRARRTLYESLLRCYVPSFMMPIFHALADTSDPRRTGLEYFATLAGSFFDIDFGRLIPPQVFIFAHNMSTEQDTSRKPEEAIENLLEWAVFRNNATNTEINVAQYFSAATEDGTYYSWMYQTLNLLFSPVTGKSILRRTNIQAIPCFNMNISADHSDVTRNVNPYIIYGNADDNNVFNTDKFIKEFSTIAKTDLDGSYQLGAIPDGLSGLAILNHGYAQTAVPTWHNLKVDASKHDTFITVSTYAQKLGFLQPSTFVPGQKIPLPKDFDAAIRRMFLWTFEKKHDEDKEPKSDRYISFDSDIHEHPPALYLLPYEEGDGPVSYAMIGGLLIESLELDGTSVPLPNPAQKLSDNNSQFAQGAIPLNHVIKGYGSQDETRINAFERAKLRKAQQQISFDLYDLAVNRLGYVDEVVEDANQPNEMPGFQPADHVRGFNRIYSKFSFRLGSALKVDKRRFAVWSPYRFIHDERNTMPQAKDIYMLTNFRAMYGTHVPLVETDAPSAVIPTS